MADFTVQDKFNPDKSFTDVKFGSDSVLLEVELNEMQKIQNHMRAEILRNMVHSGFLSMGKTLVGLDFLRTKRDGAVLVPATYAQFNFKNMMQIDAIKAVVNGFMLDISKFVDATGYSDADLTTGNLIQLPDPPATGTREDLVFLEVWFEEIGDGETINRYGGTKSGILTNDLKDSRIGEETSRRNQLKWRIRSVAGVNFGSKPEGVDDATVVKAWGANTADTTRVFTKHATDKGLYVAGDGSQASKDELRTVDGYVYAVPMFRVSRRNSGSFSVNNPTGARNAVRLVTTQAVSASEVPVTFGVTSVAGIQVGDMLISDDGTLFGKVTAIDTNANTLTTARAAFAVGFGGAINLKSDRPDGLYADIIDERDIIDLRHYAPLQKPDYKALLASEFQKYMRGELAKRATLKTYHGLRKTPTDASTVFYTSLDGTATAEIGGAPTVTGTVAFAPSVTGSGMYFDGSTHLSYPLNNLSSGVSAVTLDCFVRVKDFSNTRHFWGLYDPSSQLSVSFYYLQTGNSIRLSKRGAVLLEALKGTADKILKNFTHLRVVLTDAKAQLYVNGALVAETSSAPGVTMSFASMTVGYITGTSPSFKMIGTIADLAVSNIDRGTTFTTLPKDFTDGYAVLAPAFTGQRRQYSEAQNTQVQVGFAKLGGTGSSRGIKVTLQQNANQWTAGDKISIEGVAGEIITGVYDTDTALAKVTQDFASGGTVVYVDDVSKLAVNDTVRFYNRINNTVSGEYTISAVDTTAKTITLSSVVNQALTKEQDFVVETTASTSVPTVKFKDGSIYTQAGTWTGLGTNKAEFTLGSLAAQLNVEDLEITYSLTTPAGQAGFSEVPTAVYGGEANGGALKIGTVAVSDDFAGKVQGSVTANPNVMKNTSSASLVSPTTLSEVSTQAYYDAITALDGNTANTQTTVNGEIPQHIFAFDLIRIVEDKFGEIPSLNKVQWLKDNLKAITFKWWGHGSSASGNKANVRWWDGSTSAWQGSSFNASSTATLVTIILLKPNTDKNIDAGGFAHFIAYTDASDGVTASAINTDYAMLEVELVSKPEYSLLVPSNPRRDAGKSAVLLVRKETKEVESYFNHDNNYGIATYVEYLPVPQVLATTEDVTILAEASEVLLTDLGTSVAHKQGTHPFLNPAYRVRNDRIDMYGEFGFGSVAIARDTKDANTGAKVRVNGTGFSDQYTKQYAIPVVQKPMVGIVPYLVLHNGELKLFIFSKYMTSGTFDVDGAGVGLLVPISGKPLVKEQEGVTRTGVTTPTTWRTPTGEVQGWMNASGQIIATYQ